MSEDDLWDFGLSEAFAAAFSPSPSTQRRADEGARGGSRTDLRPEDRADLPPLVPTSQLRCGRYELSGELARGGMGVVYEGRDPRLGREVAVKVLREDLADHPALVQRFVEEAQICGQLQHPGIVPIYELGLDEDDRPFFSMKLVRGRTLAALLAERPDVTHDRARWLEIFERAAETLAYAHVRGVLHRDVKPSNILVGRFGEVQVVDWGFAKVLGSTPVASEVEEATPRTVRSEGSDSRSLTGSILGTPAYMPPEQARGEVETLDERADVFSLGAVLAEILTGQPAHVRQGDEDLLDRAAEGDLAGVHGRLTACGADPTLIELALACLQADPAERLADASEVARRAESYLREREAAARAASLEAAEARVRADTERKARRLTMALAASVVLLITAVGGFFGYREREARETREAVRGALAQAQQYAAVGAWDAAIAAVARARTRSEGAWGESLSDEVSLVEEQVASARATADEIVRRQAERRDFVETVEAIAARGTDDVATDDEDYEAAFTGFGLMAKDEVAVPAVPFDLKLVVATALDDWAGRRRLRRDGGSVGWKALLEAARRLDPDALRDQVRAALLANRLPGLQELGKGSDAAALRPRTVQLLGRTLARLGDRKAGEDLLRRGTETWPGDFGLRRELARLLIQEWESQRRRDRESEVPLPPEALRQTEAALALEPSSQATRRLLAQLAMRAGDLARARRLCEGGLRLDNEAHRTRLLLAEIAMEGESHEEAEALARAVLEARPDDLRALQRRGRALTALGRKEEAAEAFQVARRLAWQQRLQRIDEARSRPAGPETSLDELQAQVRDSSEDPEAWGRLALGFLMTSEFARAEAAAESALALDPTSVNALRLLAAAQLEQGRYEDAIDTCYRGLDLGEGAWDLGMRLESARRRLRLLPALGGNPDEWPKERSQRLSLALAALATGRDRIAAEVFVELAEEIPATGERRLQQRRGWGRPRGPEHFRREAAVAAVSAAIEGAPEEAPRWWGFALERLEEEIESLTSSRRRRGRRRHVLRQWQLDHRLEALRNPEVMSGADEDLRERAKRLWRRCEQAVSREEERRRSRDPRPASPPRRRPH